jgi:hypothetical protein
MKPLERLERVRAQCRHFGIVGSDQDIQEINLDFMSLTEALFDVSARVACGSVKFLPLLTELAALLVEVRGGVAVTKTQEENVQEVVS